MGNIVVCDRIRSTRDTSLIDVFVYAVGSGCAGPVGAASTGSVGNMGSGNGGAGDLGDSSTTGPVSGATLLVGVGSIGGSGDKGAGDLGDSATSGDRGVGSVDRAVL